MVAISSTGHLILVERICTIQGQINLHVMFNVVIQLSAILAVIVHLL